MTNFYLPFAPSIAGEARRGEAESIRYIAAHFLNRAYAFQLHLAKEYLFNLTNATATPAPPLRSDNHTPSSQPQRKPYQKLATIVFQHPPRLTSCQLLSLASFVDNKHCFIPTPIDTILFASVMTTNPPSYPKSDQPPQIPPHLPSRCR